MVALQKADTNLDEVINDVNNLVNCKNKNKTTTTTKQQHLFAIKTHGVTRHKNNNTHGKYFNLGFFAHKHILFISHIISEE